MYDSIKLGLELENVDSFEVSALTDYAQFANRDTGELNSKARLRNLKVRTYGNMLIIDGSLSKYHYGNNLACLTRGETQKALECIGNELQTDIEKAKVFRLDIALNLILDEAPCNYMPYFGSLARYKRFSIDKDNLYYATKERYFCFYDKLKECKQKKEPIPSIFVGRNVLRIENRYLKRLYKLTGSTVFAKDLYEEDFYVNCINEFRSKFQEIKRNPMSKITSQAIKNLNSKNIVDYMANEYLKEKGKDKALALIEYAQKNASFDRQRAWKLKKKIEAISTLPDFTEPNSLTNEIDKKFDLALSNFR